ncbi:MAG: hypothetical protein IJ575_05390 [Selenomonadaceae bacterium]|nr:hypothetical protein [Selenomonadaceae bacterium]
MADSNEARSLFLKLKEERDRAKIFLKSLSDVLSGNEFLKSEQTVDLEKSLSSIIEIQNELGKIDRLKEILELNNFKKLEEEISKWEDELGKSSLRDVLLRLQHLDVAGQDKEKEFCEPLKKQVEVHLNRESKIPLAKWLRDGQKFIRLAKLIEDSHSGSYDDFNQVTKDFGDKISFLVMRGMIQIPKDVPAPEPIQKSKPEPEKTPEDFAREFSEIVGNGMKKYDLDIHKYLLDESEIHVEKCEQKKDFTISKLKSRLIEISIAGREIIKKLLEDLCLRNVTSVELFVERHKTNGTRPEIKQRRGISVEKILDALFKFGYVNLCTWHGIKFYYVDSNERQLLAKVHGSIDLQKTETSAPLDPRLAQSFKSPAPSEFQNFEALSNLRRYLLIFALWKTATPVISEHIRISSDSRGDWIIANYQTPKNCLVYFFNLEFTHEKCWTEIFRFNYEMQKDLINAHHGKIIGVFLVTTKSFDETKNWIPMFEYLISSLVKRKTEAPIPISILTLDENLNGTIFDSKGNQSKNWEILGKSEVRIEIPVEVTIEKVEDQSQDQTQSEDQNSGSISESVSKSFQYIPNDDAPPIEDPFQLATIALRHGFRAQAVIALSMLSEDQKFNLGFDFAGDFSKINFDSQIVSMIHKMFQRYLPDDANYAENVLQVAIANFPPAKYSSRPLEDVEPVDLNDFQIRASILKADEMLDKLQQNTRDSKHADFIQAIVRLMKYRFAETTPSIFNANRFFDGCLLGEEYLELSTKGIPTIFDPQSICKQLDRHMRGIKATESFEDAVKKSYNHALKNYDLGTMKLLASKYSAELKDELIDFDSKVDGISKRIGKQFEIDRIEFMGQIELEYSEGKIATVEDRDSARDFVNRAFVHYSKTQNEGLFRRLIAEKFPPSNPIAEDESIHKNQTLDNFLHEYGNLFRICTQDPSREVEVKNAISRFESIQPPEDFSIQVEDRALTLNERREMARDSKSDPKMQNVLVIDQIAAMYLKNFSDDEFASKMLQITLPFSNFQPKNSATFEDLLNAGFDLPQKILEMIQNRTSEIESVLSVFYRQCIESIAEGYRQGIFRTVDSPAYKLDEKFLKIAMADGRFNDSIDSAFRKSLANDGILAVFQSAVLILYRSQRDQFTRNQISEIFEEYALDTSTIDLQIQKLIDLKILEIDGENYSLKTSRSLAGAESEIEDSLMKLTLEGSE